MKPIVIYDDFRGGEWGKLGAKRAAKNQFHGENVLVYPDGQIGPRPGITDLGIAHVWDLVAPGKPVAMGHRPGTTTLWYAFVNAGFMNVYYFDATKLYTASPTALGSPVATTHPEGALCQTYDRSDGSFSYFGSRDKMWRIDWSGPTVAKVSGSPTSNRALAHYGERFVTGYSNVIRYSAPATALTWPAANTITVGESNITALYVVRGNLVIMTEDYAVWVLSGVPGVNEYLREVIPRYEGHIDRFDWTAGDVERGARLWLAGPGSDSPASVIPEVFGGSAITNEYSDLEVDAFRNTNAFVPWASPSTLRAITTALFQADDVSILGAGNDYSHPGAINPNGVVRHAGVWTRHRYVWPDHAHALMSVHMGDGRMIVMTETDEIDDPPQTNAINVQAVWDKVPVAREDIYGLMRLGDNNDTPVSAHFDLSEFWLPDGQEFIIRKIIVDATVYDIANNEDTGIATILCGFQMNVVRVGVDPGPANYASGGADTQTGAMTVSIDPTTLTVVDRNDDGGAQLAFPLNPPPVSGRGMRIQIVNLVGMAIRRITVLGEYDPPR